MLERFDFTLHKYLDLCQSIQHSKYVNLTLAEYLRDTNYQHHPVAIMRHDIDQNCKFALDLARVEYQCKIKATYYFRFSKKTYNTGIIDQIAAYGHEIGYHYETLDRCKGNLEKAKILFSEELSIIRKKYAIMTVCAHGNPLTPFDNKVIWKTLNLSDYGLSGEAFLALDFDKFAYFSDSGRTWQNSKTQKMPGKDDVITAFEKINVKNTDGLIQIVKDGTLPNICILTHPERWSKNMIDFVARYGVDLVFYFGKAGITVYRQLKK